MDEEALALIIARGLAARWSDTAKPDSWLDAARAALSAIREAGWGNLAEAYERAASVAETCEWWTSPMKDGDERGPIAAAIRALTASTDPRPSPQTRQQTESQ